MFYPAQNFIHRRASVVHSHDGRLFGTDHSTPPAPDAFFMVVLDNSVFKKYGLHEAGINACPACFAFISVNDDSGAPEFHDARTELVREKSGGIEYRTAAGAAEADGKHAAPIGNAVEKIVHPDPSGQRDKPFGYHGIHVPHGLVHAYMPGYARTDEFRVIAQQQAGILRGIILATLRVAATALFYDDPVGRFSYKLLDDSPAQYFACRRLYVGVDGYVSYIEVFVAEKGRRDDGDDSTDNGNAGCAGGKMVERPVNS